MDQKWCSRETSPHHRFCQDLCPHHWHLQRCWALQQHLQLSHKLKQVTAKSNLGPCTQFKTGIYQAANLNQDEPWISKLHNHETLPKNRVGCQCTDMQIHLLLFEKAVFYKRLSVLECLNVFSTISVLSWLDQTTTAESHILVSSCKPCASNRPRIAMNHLFYSGGCGWDGKLVILGCCTTQKVSATSLCPKPQTCS